MSRNVYDAYVWAKENVPARDASDDEWEEFARKAIDFGETYRGGDDSEYRAVSAIIVQRCDAVFEGVPIIQGPLELDRRKDG